MRKFFNVKVKPRIVYNINDFAADDVLFDFTPFDVPKGAVELVSGQMMVRVKSNLSQNVGVNDTNELIFCKDLPGGVAPGSIGTPHATAGGTGYYHNLLGSIHMSGDPLDALDFVGIISAAGGFSGDGLPLVLQGEPDSGTNVGYDRLYVAGIHKVGSQPQAYNFYSGILVDGAFNADGSVSSINVDNGAGASAGAGLKLDKGDVLETSTGQVLGTVKSISMTNTDDTITFEEPITLDGGPTIADNTILHNPHPIMLQFGFEI
tara:strand:+ start:354 stop:1142 length:789 start_codon:yes stop_codon:yes gene_type:complete